jgi:hypothetical protein
MNTNQNQVVNKDSLFVYAMLPFHIVSEKGGGFFDLLNLNHLKNDNIAVGIKEIKKILDPITDKNKTHELNEKKELSIGDVSKYYNFIRTHFGHPDTSANLELFPINQNKLFPYDSNLGFKNFGSQFDLNERKYYLGKSNIFINKIDSIDFLLNPMAGLGYLLFGFELASDGDELIMNQLAQSDFFRNIGWREGQKESKTNEQFKKHSLSIINSATQEREHHFSFFNIINIYFRDLIDSVRFYQNRMTMLYVSNSYELGNQDHSKLSQLFFDVLRIPDRNSLKFNLDLSYTEISSVGRNIVFNCLNEGAVIIETVNQSNNESSIANKFLPGFILAINQREVLLKTMHKISFLESKKLMAMENEQMNYINQLKIDLLVIQLKQIFYSVSNYHEVEYFFNHLQKVFNIDVMMKENEQSIREIHNLLEEKRKNIESEKEEFRSRIVNTILGAIACLGLFSFFKDVWPFFLEKQIASFYKLISISLPFVIMGWLIWYMFRRKSK